MAALLRDLLWSSKTPAHHHMRVCRRASCDDGAVALHCSTPRLASPPRSQRVPMYVCACMCIPLPDDCRTASHERGSVCVHVSERARRVQWIVAYDSSMIPSCTCEALSLTLLATRQLAANALAMPTRVRLLIRSALHPPQLNPASTTCVAAGRALQRAHHPLPHPCPESCRPGAPPAKQSETADVGTREALRSHVNAAHT